MSPSERPTKAERREEARQAALALRAKQEAEARRNRLIGIIGAAVVLVVFVAVAILIVTRGTEDESLPQTRPSFAAANGGGVVMDADGIVTPPADADESWPVGGFGDAVVVTVYSDPICPWCQVFEQQAMPILEEMRLNGEVVLDHRVVGNLDNQSMGARYSTRAAAALYTVADLAPEAYVGFEKALFDNQPAEGTTGLTDEEIANIARISGVPEDAASAIGNGDYIWWVGQVTNAARELYDGRLATPSVRLNGEPLGEVDWRDEAQLRQAIEDARG